MRHGPPSLARLVAWSVLLFGLSAGCGAGCGDSTHPPPVAHEMPDADRSSVEVSKAQGVRANGKDAVAVKVTVRKADGTPLSGRTVKVTVSGEGNTLTQPAGPTDDQGVASATLTSTTEGTKTVTASVDAEGGPVTLSSRPTVGFVVLPAARLAFTAAPGSGTAGAVLGVSEVVIQDGDGETVTSASNTVTVAIGSGPATAALKGTVSVRAVNGVARFSELVLEKAAKGYTLVASAEGLTGATSQSFDVASAAPASLALSAPLSPVTAGSPVSVEVSVLDAFNNEVAGYTGTVRFSSDDASATLPADYTFTAADGGRHAFTNQVALKQAGTRQVSVMDMGAAALTASAGLAVVPGAATRLAFTQQPVNRSVRSAFDVQVALTDDFGNLAPVSAPAVSLSLNKAGTLAGFASVSPVDGVASFPGLSIAQEDTGYVLTASAAGLATVLSNAFTITDDVAPAAPVLSQTAATPTAFTVAWTAVGDDGMSGQATSYELRYSTSAIVSNADFAAATLVPLAAPKPVGSPESVMVSGLTQNTSYYVALKVTDNQGNAVRSASLPVSTTNPTAAKVVFTVQPRSGTAGSALATLQVQIQDPDGLIVANATSAVTLTVVGATGLGTLTVAADKGVATFSDVRIEKAGKGYTLTASSPGLTSDTSTAFDIAPADAKSLELSGLGSTVNAGDNNSVTVKALDPYGNLAEGYTGTVSFSSTDTTASKPADYTFTATDKGQHTFSGVVLRTSGTQSLTVSAAGLTSSTQSTEVGAAAPSKLLLTGLPAAMTAGDSATVTVEARDGFDNRATGYTGTVRFSSTDGKAVLPGEYTFTAADKGLKTFPVTLKTAGAPSVTSVMVEDKAAPATLNAKADTTVTWNVPVSLVLTAPDSVVAGNPLRVTVTAFDAYGNTVKDYTGTVGFSADADQATLPADYAFAASDAGSRQFDVTLRKAVSTQLTVTDAALGLSASHTVSVSQAAVAALVIGAPPGPFTAGTPFIVDITLKDAFGNVTTGYTGTVGFTSSDAQAVLPANYTFTAGDAGHKSFSVTLKTAGDSSVSAKDLAQAFLADSAALHIDPSTPTKLVFRDQPADVKVRAKLAPVTVGITDVFGNLVPVGTPSITVALAGGNPAAVFGGTLTVMPVGGVATFPDLTVDQQGTNFRLDAMGGTLDAGSSNPFTVVDDVAPATTTLAVTHMTSIQMTLHWTSVGDDGLLGTAVSYDLRYSTSPIDAASFDTATEVVAGAPQAPGSDESFTVTGLSPSTHYYFALKVRDDANNASLSFMDSTTNTDPCIGHTCTVPAPACTSDGVSFVTTTSTCVDVDNTATCQESQTTTACVGTNAVCFKGACDTASSPTANQLSVSEVMHSPSAGTTEYIELTNNTSNLLNLNGLKVTYVDGAGNPSFTVGSGSVPVVMDRKGTFVLAQNKDQNTNGRVSADYEYGSAITLASTGELKIENGATSVEDFKYTSSFPQLSGRSMNLSSLVVGTKANAKSWYWCDSDVQLVMGGDYGTPNAPNSTCGMTVKPPVDWCILQFPTALSPITAGTPKNIISQFREPGVTDRNLAGNDVYPHVVGELGYGNATSSVDTWTWTPISFDATYTPSSSDADQMNGTLRILSAGSYHYGFRYHLEDPFTGAPSSYVYCDTNGPVDPSSPSASFGTVTVNPVPPTTHVVISEFSAGTSANALDEFIELYNPTSSAVNISGWVVQYKPANGLGYTFSSTIPTATIQPKGYYLLGGSGYSGTVTSDASYTFDTASTGGHVRIGQSGIGVSPSDPKTVDTLGYGPANTPEGTAAPVPPAPGGSLERKADVGSTSASMAPGGSDATRGNGYDTDNNANDFVTRDVRDPQNSSSATETPQ